MVIEIEKNKYVCPICGGQLELWRDDTIKTRADIDKKTGKVIESTVKHLYFPTAMNLAKFNYTCKGCEYEFYEVNDSNTELCDNLDIINENHDIYKSEYTECIKNGKIKVKY